MVLGRIESLPKKRGTLNNLQGILRDFMDSGYGLTRVTLTELDRPYKSIYSFRASLCCAVKRSRYPVRVKMRGEEVFLIRIKV